VIVTVIDSSAVLRLCFGEGDLDDVAEAMRATPVVSTVATVEIPAAISARFHRGQISATQKEELGATASHLLASTTQIYLNEAVVSDAVQLTDRFPLRTLDAIHVATALVVARQQRRRGNVVRFCTADQRQGRVAASVLGESHVVLVPPM
jgi:predicted nucleic acid-binding protein